MRSPWKEDTQCFLAASWAAPITPKTCWQKRIIINKQWNGDFSEGFHLRSAFYRYFISWETLPFLLFFNVYTQNSQEEKFFLAGDGSCGRNTRERGKGNISGSYKRESWKQAKSGRKTETDSEFVSQRSKSKGKGKKERTRSCLHANATAW